MTGVQTCALPICTDLQSPESVEHLCEKCKNYAANWQPTADEIWSAVRTEQYAGEQAHFIIAVGAFALLAKLLHLSLIHI